MADTYLRQSPLAHLHLDARAANDSDLDDAGLMIGERKLLGMINLRGKAADPAFKSAVKKALGVDLPAANNRSSGSAGSLHMLALGPDEWLVITPAGSELKTQEKLTKAMAKLHVSITMTGEARTTIRISGRNARDVLSKGCPLDLHPRAFGPGACAQTILARADMTVHQTAWDGKAKVATYDIIVLRSFAEYIWTWLEDAGREYGVKVVAGGA